jgi:hypothetical protein
MVKGGFMLNYFTGQSKWQEAKDDLILKRIEAEPEREKELMALSDRADALILKNREHNYKVENNIKD